ncbi:DEAD/DEAH box helicase [Paenibacillus alvei]|uniref:DEAD/DEAH box helicase n=1 Tax=Paenibacillus alvei TaxID=44250 RepID=A0ABT4H186_PAEAL|nr:MULTISPECIES: DEAD/DEAH box helicase [Paenibacillus]EJW14903.1 putative ATP-dependent RNA helicase YfmL [Paenibacillus alvei DSM 29]MCY9539143.1 DEAD/DEAH box helicase [Paenibacillus alvei]MCY9704335.1 DEAD/DEAH box helicase [Paenibacillus alvei]MCY9734349.1 DEAD/DEAH box helicase [Paenibacillus alvei]MCY9753526.1 DEAD/DEAH box helicase [Paenibacillus alvei]
MLSATFESFSIREELKLRLQARHITEPSPVQLAAIPAALEGRDVLAQSQTGTGKTIAYLLPVLTRIQHNERTTQAVIVAPTQELAMQIVREAEYYSEGSSIQIAAIIGGAALKRQVEKLKLHPQLVIGTPGRIRELIEMRKLKMHEVRTIVVDEVDHVLQKGGAGDTDYIMRSALRDRQLLFFSATLPEEVKALAERWMQDPVNIGIEPEKRIADTIEHLVFVCEERDKIDMLRRLVRHWNPKQAIVFINDSAEIAEWEQKLSYAHLSVASLYGDAPKQERVNVLKRFREGHFQLLLATDVAARGLDIPDLPFVFSAQPALNAEHYVHRAGRTGRMGRQGVSVNLISPREQFIMKKFERELEIVIHERSYYDGRIIDSNDADRRPKTKPASKQPFGKSSAGARSQSRDKRSGKDKDKGAPKWLKEKQKRR